jgi:hypothetical protein
MGVAYLPALDCMFVDRPKPHRANVFGATLRRAFDTMPLTRSRIHRS